MKHIKRLIIALLYMVICLFSWQIGRCCGVKRGIEDSKLTINNLPKIEDVQSILGVKVDGKLGSQTQIKWQQAIDMSTFNGYASEYDYNTGLPK